MPSTIVPVFLYSLKKHLFITCPVPGAIPDAGDTAMNEVCDGPSYCNQNYMMENDIMHPQIRNSLEGKLLTT